MKCAAKMIWSKFYASKWIQSDKVRQETIYLRWSTLKYAEVPWSTQKYALVHWSALKYVELR